MKYTYMVPINGEYVDLKTLPEEQQEEIKKQVTERLAEAIAKEEAKAG